MTAVSHAKVSTVPDGPDSSLVLPSDWNAAHTVDWALAADLASEAFGGTADAGTSSKVPRADHRHPMGTPTTVATDTLWDAAGDLAVGSGADTAARLAIGGAGGALSVINGAVAWNSGTSFPATPATGDRYWRTDLGMEFYWDGTRWVTTTLYHEPIATQDTVGVNSSSTAGTWQRAVLWGGEYAIYVYKIHAWCYVGATNDGSKYWTVSYITSPSATNLGSFSTSGDAASGHRSHVVTVNAVVASTDLEIEVQTAKTSTPSALYLSSAMTYRVIAT